MNVQRGAMLAALFAFVCINTYIDLRYSTIYSTNFQTISLQCVSIFTIVTAAFDLYCLSMAAPGSTHYGYYFISYEFVYVGNRHGM